jgi:hypothetical protein
MVSPTAAPTGGFPHQPDARAMGLFFRRKLCGDPRLRVGLVWEWAPSGYAAGSWAT